MKKIIALFCVAVLLLSFTVMADTTENTIIVNGTPIESGYVEKDGITMIPVRKVCETLGFTVTWDATTNDVVIEKSPLYYTFNVYKDGYTVSKTAPILLGTNPYVVDGTTYVPMSFAGEIIPCGATLEEGVLNIVSEPSANKGNKVVFVEETDGMYIFYDAKIGNVIVNISEECVINGDIKSMEKGQIVNVVYDNFMTMSLPPITNALEISVCEGEMAEILTSQVCEVVADETSTQIVVGNAESPMEQVALNVGEDTVILGLEGDEIKAGELTANTKITAVVSMASTRSIPPQRFAYSVRVSE